MLGLRILGLLLFWGGFLAGAVAMVMQWELDALSPAEKTALLAVDAKFAVPRDVVLDLSDNRPLKELDEAQFLLVLDRCQAWWENDLEVRQQHEVAQAAAAERGETLAPLPPPAKPLNKIQLIKRRSERLTNLWPVIRWTYYLPAVVVCLIGVALIHFTKQQAQGDQAANHSNLQQLRQQIRSLVQEVMCLETNLPTLAPEHVVAQIDQRCVGYCNEFADNREVLKDAFGLEGFAEVMSEFASGERFLNRVWSAAADGYMEEAQKSLATSLHFFLAAEQRLEERIANRASPK